MDVARDELGRCLRRWRDRVSPLDVGMPAQTARRVPGLRREEVAQLAGVSLDYLARLEQGRATNPSPSVLASLARVLELSDDERAHLFRRAGYAEPSRRAITRHLSSSVKRLLARLTDVPVIVFDASWQILAANELATELIGDVSNLSGRERNIAWRHFTGATSRLVRTHAEETAADAHVVADLREALGRYPADKELGALIDDLRDVSPRFAELWAELSVAPHSSDTKTFLHPEVGPITLDCDVLVVQGSDLRLVVYTAESESPDAAALAELQVRAVQSAAW